MDSHRAELTALQHNAGGTLQSKAFFLFFFAQTLPVDTWVLSFPMNGDKED